MASEKALSLPKIELSENTHQTKDNDKNNSLMIESEYASKERDAFTSKLVRYIYLSLFYDIVISLIACN